METFLKGCNRATLVAWPRRPLRYVGHSLYLSLQEIGVVGSWVGNDAISAETLFALGDLDDSGAVAPCPRLPR